MYASRRALTPLAGRIEEIQHMAAAQDQWTCLQEDSERLLQETGEALEAKLGLEGIQDIRAMMHALDDGRSLHPLHLTAVASTLLAARALEEQISAE